MQPTTLLADPAMRFRRVGRARPASRIARAAVRRRKVSWGYLPLAFLIAAVVGGFGYLRVWPPLATVMSASMAPTIDTGDVVVLRKLGRPARVGDIVAVNVPEDARSRYGYPPVIIHRIVRIAGDGTVTTKGDARKDPDPFTVPRRGLTAHVVAHVPAAGRVVAFLTSSLGLLWLAGGAVMLIGLPLLERRRDGQLTLGDQLTRLREDRAAADARCDELSQQLRQVTEAFTAHVADLPTQLAAAVAAAVVAPQPAPVEPATEIATESAPEAAPLPAAAPPPAVQAPAETAPPIAFAAARPWAPSPPIAFAAARPWAPSPPIASVAARLWAPAPPIASVAARLWAASPPIAFVAARLWAPPSPIASVAARLWAPAPPIASVAARLWAPQPPIAFVAAHAWAGLAPADPLDQLALALFAGPRAEIAPDASDEQLAFALDVERTPRFARPCENQLAFALEEARAARPDQLVISTPPPAPRATWDAPPPSILVRRRSGGLVGRALSLLAA